MGETGNPGENRLDRRSFLGRGVGALAALAGFGPTQDDGQARVTRRFVLERVSEFERQVTTDDYVGRGVLVAAQSSGEPPRDFTTCTFPDWNPAGFQEYQVVIFDINDGAITRGRAFVTAGRDRIPQGTPYAITAEYDCPGRWVGVEGEQIPGRLVE